MVILKRIEKAGDYMQRILPWTLFYDGHCGPRHVLVNLFPNTIFGSRLQFAPLQGESAKNQTTELVCPIRRAVETEGWVLADVIFRRWTGISRRLGWFLEALLLWVLQ